MTSWQARLAAVALVAASFTLAAPSSAAFLGIKPANPLTSANDVPPIDERALVRYARKGFGSIKGHLSVPDTTKVGADIIFSDNDVFLVPDVPYTHWYFMDYLTRNFKRMEKLYARSTSKEDRLEPLKYDATAMKYTRRYHTDSDGRYEFLNLPTGNYFVVAVVNSVEDGTIARAGLFGASVTNYKVEYLQLLGDDPSYQINGDSPANATALKRIVPNSRSGQVPCLVAGRPGHCIDAIDLDQFTGGRGDY